MRFRFSLRRLVIFLTCATIAAGILGIRARRVERQARFYRDVNSICGVISASHLGEVRTWYEFAVGSYPQYKIVRASFNGKRVPIEAVELLRRCHSLVELDLGGSDCDNTTLELVIHACPDVRKLILSSTAITDECVAHLSQLTSLEQLNLGSTSITDECVVHLSQLTSLERLDLGGTSLTGVGFSLVGTHCRSLRLIDFYGSELSAEGLREIAEHCPSLETLDISYTKIDAIDLIVLSKAERLKSLRAFGIDVPEHIRDELSFLLPGVSFEYDHISNSSAR